MAVSVGAMAVAELQPEWMAATRQVGPMLPATAGCLGAASESIATSTNNGACSSRGPRPATSGEVEQFIGSNREWLTEDAEQILRVMNRVDAKRVIAAGTMSNCRDPIAVIRSRIRSSREGSRGADGRSAMPGADPLLLCRTTPRPATPEELEAFIASNRHFLGEDAEEILRAMNPIDRKRVIAAGTMSGCRDPVAVIRSRVRQAREQEHEDQLMAERRVQTAGIGHEVPVLTVGGGSRLAAPATAEELDAFIAGNRRWMTDEAEDLLRAFSSMDQKRVIAAGTMSGCRDPVAVVQTRVKRAREMEQDFDRLTHGTLEHVLEPEMPVMPKFSTEAAVGYMFTAAESVPVSQSKFAKPAAPPNRLLENIRKEMEEQERPQGLHAGLTTGIGGVVEIIMRKYGCAKGERLRCIGETPTLWQFEGGKTAPKLQEGIGWRWVLVEEEAAKLAEAEGEEQKTSSDVEVTTKQQQQEEQEQQQDQHMEDTEHAAMAGAFQQHKQQRPKEGILPVQLPICQESPSSQHSDEGSKGKRATAFNQSEIRHKPELGIHDVDQSEPARPERRSQSRSREKWSKRSKSDDKLAVHERKGVTAKKKSVRESSSCSRSKEGRAASGSKRKRRSVASRSRSKEKASKKELSKSKIDKAKESSRSKGITKKASKRRARSASSSSSRSTDSSTESRGRKARSPSGKKAVARKRSRSKRKASEGGKGSKARDKAKEKNAAKSKDKAKETHIVRSKDKASKRARSESSRAARSCRRASPRSPSKRKSSRKKQTKEASHKSSRSPSKKQAMRKRRPSRKREASRTPSERKAAAEQRAKSKKKKRKASSPSPQRQKQHKQHRKKPASESPSRAASNRKGATEHCEKNGIHGGNRGRSKLRERRQKRRRSGSTSDGGSAGSGHKGSSRHRGNAAGRSRSKSMGKKKASARKEKMERQRKTRNRSNSTDSSIKGKQAGRMKNRSPSRKRAASRGRQRHRRKRAEEAKSSTSASRSEEGRHGRKEGVRPNKKAFWKKATTRSPSKEAKVVKQPNERGMVKRTASRSQSAERESQQAKPKGTNAATKMRDASGPKPGNKASSKPKEKRAKRAKFTGSPVRREASRSKSAKEVAINERDASTSSSRTALPPRGSKSCENAQTRDPSSSSSSSSSHPSTDRESVSVSKAAQANNIECHADSSSASCSEDSDQD